jgi:hypothetical protein
VRARARASTLLKIVVGIARLPEFERVETTEKIVEAYVRYVKGWATIPNIKCGNQKEIDLFAIDPVSLQRYHIETSVSISNSFRALTTKPFLSGDHKDRVKAASARRTLGFFLEEKFQATSVKQALAGYGAGDECRQIIVAWEWKKEAEEVAAAHGILLWDFRDLMRDIAELGRHDRTYFTDDTLRTLTLFAKATAHGSKASDREPAKVINNEVGKAAASNAEAYYLYENWIHRRARLHRGSCSYCNSGRGTQGATEERTGRWYGPIPDREEAIARLMSLKHDDKKQCGSCMAVVAQI